MAKLIDTHIYGTLISDGLITAKANIDVGSYLKLNTSNTLGKPNINIGKPGNNFLGIGSKDTTTSNTIRYGASDGTNWLNKNTTYNHEFDGNIKADLIYENGSRVWTSATFDPDTKLDVKNGQVEGDLGISQDLTVGRNLLVKNNLNINGISTFTNDITVAGVKFSQKLGVNDNAVSASKLKNPVTINGVLFDGSASITVKAEATGGVADTCRGNAESATKLQTPRTINGTAFDGTTNISITAPANGGTSDNCRGNSATATKLQTPRAINGVNFDGTTNINITAPANGGTSASCSGNSSTATKLQTARTINGVAFDGTQNISISAPANGGTSASCSGNSATASKLQTARTINGVAFDGTSNITVKAEANGGTSANCSGNSATASRLLHSLTINGQSFNGSSDMTISIDDKGKLPITGGTLTGNLNIQGELVCTGNVTAFATSLSDRRLKENLVSIDNATDIINKIKIYQFNFKNNPEKKYGVIAQEIQEILPDTIVQTPIQVEGDFALGVNYQDIFAILVKAVQEQDKRIKELESKLQ